MRIILVAIVIAGVFALIAPPATAAARAPFAVPMAEVFSPDPAIEKVYWHHYHHRHYYRHHYD